MSRLPLGISVGLLILVSTTSLHTQQAPQSLVLSERPGGETLEGSAADGSGGVWIVGRSVGGVTTSADALQTQPGGAEDAVIEHIGADGSLLYSTYLGGSGGDWANAVALDAAGNVYVVGGTASDNFPATPGYAVHGGGFDAFLVKLDPTGKHLIYGTYLGGTKDDEAFGVAVDAAGHAHVVGSTWGDFYASYGQCVTSTSEQSAFYTEFSTDGSHPLFSTCFTDSTAAGVTVDANGNAYVVGRAGPHFGPRMGSFIGTFPAGSTWQGFLATLNTSQTNPIPSSMFIGGADGNDNANAVAVTSRGVYVAGTGTSTQYPGASRQATLNAQGLPDYTAWIMKVALDGTQILGTTLVDGAHNDQALALQVDSSEVVHVTGETDSSDLPVTSDAAQPAFAGWTDAWYATAWMPNNVVGPPNYLTYLGGSNTEFARALALDGTGGAWIAGDSASTDLPNVDAKTNATDHAFVARFGQPVTGSGSAGDIVLYTRDVASIGGNWQLVADSTAAGGVRIWNPDAGVPKIATPAASPANYFDMTFTAQAGVPYHLWLRMKADNDSYQNDSVFVQFSDSVDANGNPIWRISSTSATVVSLEDCSGCGEQGWGWNDNGYATAGQMVTFAASGTHTIRVQQREDGVSIDQIILSSTTWANTPPGLNKNDTTIVSQGGGTANQPPTLTLTSPTDGTTLTAPASITVSGTASDPDGSVSNVSIYINGELKSSGQPTNGQISATWSDLPAGTYTFTVVATDNQGASATSSPRTVTVTAASSNQPPTVSITSPANGSSATQGTRLVVNASASDSDGIIAKVDFYANSTLVWTDTAAPYHFTFESFPAGTYSLTAVATDNDHATTTSAPVSITVAPSTTSFNLPPYFEDTDIGDVGASGSVTANNDTFTIQGSGADVWGTEDALNYTYEELVRDGAIIARVASVSGEANWVKAGVMIRRSLSPDAAQAFMLVSHAKGVAFQRRLSDGATSLSMSGTASTAPRWVKLVRNGNVITGYESEDGTTWMVVGSETFSSMPAGTGVYVGLAVSSHVRGTLSTATFDNVTVIDAIGPNQAPTISITSPSSGATFTAPATIEIGVTANDDVKVQKIDFYANSTLIGTLNGNSEVSNYTFTWSNVPAGTYTLTAVASDGEGASTTSAPVSITVNGGSSGGECASVTLSQTSFYSGGPASTWNVTVTAPSDMCTWTANIDQSWLALNGVTGPTTIAGTGSGKITLQTTDNHTGANRFGTFTIGGTAYKVTQESF